MKTRYWILIIIFGFLMFYWGTNFYNTSPTVRPASVQSGSEPISGRIDLNLCETDPENADYWAKTKVNLFNVPEGTKVGDLPACSSLSLEVLSKQTVNGIQFYKVKYNSFVGWQTKRLLIGTK